MICVELAQKNMILFVGGIQIQFHHEEIKILTLLKLILIFFSQQERIIFSQQHKIK